MRPRTHTTEPLEAAIARAREVLESDERILALWLEGSFAVGTADPWSDIDLHVVVEDADWDAFLTDRVGLIERVAPIISSVASRMPWSAELIAATIEGGIRLDLYSEKRSQLRAAIRHGEPRVLFDRAAIADELYTNWPADMLARMRLEEVLRTFFYGSTFPIRLAGREEWGSLLHNALLVVFQFLVPAMLITDDRGQFFRPQLHNERHLTPARRREVDALVAEIVAAFNAAPPGRAAAISAAHEHLVAATWREFRAACEKLRVTYPADAERRMSEYYAREMGWTIE